MLIAINGSQGSGKSTILNTLKDRGFNVVERKTSRSILSDWNVTLQEVNNNPSLTKKFQNEIIKRKLADEEEAVRSKSLWFAERTFADLFTYALVSVGKDNTYSDWLNQYYLDCMTCNQSYAAVYFLKAGHFLVHHDGVRGSNSHYSRMVDLIMLDITQQMTTNNKLTIIETPDLEQRIGLITIQSQHFHAFQK
jgi:predicted ATPase